MSLEHIEQQLCEQPVVQLRLTHGSLAVLGHDGGPHKLLLLLTFSCAVDDLGLLHVVVEILEQHEHLIQLDLTLPFADHFECGILVRLLIAIISVEFKQPLQITQLGAIKELGLIAARILQFM